MEQTSKSVGEDDAAYGQAAAAVKCAAAAREGVSQAQATKRALQAAADEEAKANGEDAEYALTAAPWHSNLHANTCACCDAAGALLWRRPRWRRWLVSCQKRAQPTRASLLP